VLAVLAVLVSAGLVAGAAALFVSAGDGEGTTKAVSPLVTSPTPSETPTEPAPEPTVSPTPGPTATPTPTPTPTVTSSPTATASARPSTTSSPTRTYAYPRPSRRYDGLTLTVTADQGGGDTRTVFKLTVEGKDGDGEVYFDGIRWGDGSGVPSAGSPQHCKSYPPLTSPPGAYQPEPDTATYVYKHRYTKPGAYVVEVQVSSISKDCKPHGPEKETRKAQLTLVVEPAPAASPTPVPSPSPS